MKATPRSVVPAPRGLTGWPAVAQPVGANGALGPWQAVEVLALDEPAAQAGAAFQAVARHPGVSGLEGKPSKAGEAGSRDLTGQAGGALSCPSQPCGPSDGRPSGNLPLISLKRSWEEPLPSRSQETTGAERFCLIAGRQKRTRATLGWGDCGWRSRRKAGGPCIPPLGPRAGLFPPPSGWALLYLHCGIPAAGPGIHTPAWGHRCSRSARSPGHTHSPPRRGQGGGSRRGHRGWSRWLGRETRTR